MASDGTSDGDEALEALRWRDEILGVLYWLRGEGIMADAAPEDLGGFLVAQVAALRGHLERLAAEGYLERVGEGEVPRYRLSDTGGQQGGRVFADDFAELTGAAHGECGPGCSCQVHGAAACKIPAA
ncbi:MAG: hypothetical protein M3Q65_00170 [Chloroflexota bacterium]|nr:hypothetical protein [Chloroflexota bacterium]